MKFKVEQVIPNQRNVLSTKATVTASSTYGKMVLSTKAAEILNVKKGDKVGMYVNSNAENPNQKIFIGKVSMEAHGSILNTSKSKGKEGHQLNFTTGEAWINAILKDETQKVRKSIDELVDDGVLRPANGKSTPAANITVEWSLSEETVTVEIGNGEEIEVYMLENPVASPVNARVKKEGTAE